jgi:hypothetical protein
METWEDRLQNQAIDMLEAVIQRLYRNSLASHFVHYPPFCDKSGLAQSVSVSFRAGVVSNRAMTSQKRIA